MIPILPSKVYDVLKQVALIWLPASGAAYVSFSLLFGLPGAEYVSGSIVIIETFLGATLGISKAKFDGTQAALTPVAGTANLDPNEPIKLVFEAPLESFADKRQVLLNIVGGDKLAADAKSIPITFDETEGTGSTSSQ